MPDVPASQTAPDAPVEGEPHGSTEETPSIEALQAQIEDLKKHSRKWEERAKDNKKAADELAAQRQASMTDDEKRTEALTAAEKRAVDAEDRATRAEAALLRFQVATEYGLSKEDADALASVTDEKALRTLAERLSAAQHSGRRPNPAQGRRQATGPESAKDVLADFFDTL